MDLKIESRKTMKRLLSADVMAPLSTSQRAVFEKRLTTHFHSLFCHLYEVYGNRYDFHFHLDGLIKALVEAHKSRARYLKSKDNKRLKEPNWYRSEKMVGMACYVDLFSDDLNTLHQRIPYLKRLGINYLHLMPLYRSPEEENDGGYAVSDYREVNPQLGTMDDLKNLSRALSSAGINLVLDFVFNHTSDQHRWAQEAKKGDTEFQQYYYMFDDKQVPDQYEQNLREIFPQVRRGNFSWEPVSAKWVWTTFNNYQWDLNYSNPEVFTAIAEEMLFLANVGCDGLRLDALAFIWKELGTDCENQPKAHALIKAFNCCLQIVAPAVVFKSEAIVHPDEVVKYIDQDECQLSYNPLLMALLWNSLATRKTRLLTQSMKKSFAISPDCAWVNYIRCHDDIGWTFDDSVAGQLGINGQDHRHFLNQFYTDRFEGSFASGIPFGENPTTGDCRVCGSLASLVGLDKAIASDDPLAIDLSVNRILLLHSIILSIGGIPLLYSGDELGLLNNEGYLKEPSKKDDARWVHRIALEDEQISRAQSEGTLEHRIFSALKDLIEQRKNLSLMGDSDTEILESENQHVFAYGRQSAQDKLLILNNFSEASQIVPVTVLDYLESTKPINVLDESLEFSEEGEIILKPYQFAWLR